MIDQVMKEVNNHFVYSDEKISLDIVDPNQITGDFKERYLPGQYICLNGTILNDGVYKILNINGKTITLDTDALLDEQTEGISFIFGLRPPKAFLSLVAEIESYAANNNKDGISSEAIDDYSVSFKEDGGWKSVFKAKLNTYRRMYSDLE